MSAAAVLIAAALDWVGREPPLAVHPVRVMGRYLHAAERYVPATPAVRAVACGGLAWAVGSAATTGLGHLVERWVVRRARPALGAPLLGLTLWPLLSHRLLLDEVAAVERALAESLDAGRAAVARIVSRDVADLSEAEVRQAAIESLAENLSDSVVAPLVWFAIGGLPAAALYRFANTADACWGYHTPRWQYAGRVAARADDLLNLAPSRLTGLVLLGTAAELSVLREQAGRTPSPNAGWPMAALAIRLGVRLGKPGVYTLNPAGRPPAPADTAVALRLARRRGWFVVGLAALAAGVRARRLARRSR